MNIFYCPDAVLNQYCALDETESRHVGTVLRKNVGDEIYVFDGKGSLYKATIATIGKREVAVHISALHAQDNQDTPKLHIAIAPPKNLDRFEWFAEKVTEIGITEITPIICRHSERKELKNERIDKILLSAAKQSMKYTLPQLNEAVPIAKFLMQMNDAEKYIAYCDEKSVHLKALYTKGKDALILIGPEGDFTAEEVALAEKQGFKTVSLGKARLRLETAGIYAATVFNVANE